jgi:sugar diacid utilization regulator
MTPSLPANLQREHALMLDSLRAACCGVIEDDRVRARDRLAALARLQARHISHAAIRLLSRLPLHLRKSSEVYLAEHRKLESLLQHIQTQWQARPVHLAEPTQRLALLHALHPLRHVLEHHCEREEQALHIETLETHL